MLGEILILSLFVVFNFSGKEINVTYPRNSFNLQLIVKRLLGKEFATDLLSRI